VAAARQHDQAAQLRHEPRQIGYVPIHARKLDDRIAVARDIEAGTVTLIAPSSGEDGRNNAMSPPATSFR
jgi:hypothetical protein